MNSRQSRRLFKAGWTVLVIIESLLIIYYALPLILGTPSPILIVRTDSMLPVITPGNAVIIKGIGESDMTQRIIAYYNPSQGRIMVHRALVDHGDRLITKGDNSAEQDLFQPSRDFVLGEVKFVIRT